MGTQVNFYGVLKEVSQTPSFFASNSFHSETTYAPRHSHDFGCLHFTVKGLYQESIEGEDFRIEPNRVLYKPPGIDHGNEFRNRGAYTCRIELHPSALKDVSLPNRPMNLTNPKLSNLFRQVERELHSKDNLSGLAIEGLSWEILCQLIRSSCRPQHCSSSLAKNVEEIVRAQFPDPPSVTELSALLGVHRSQLARTFKKSYGTSISDFVRQLRIEKAMELLRNTKSSIAEIALTCGFSDQSHFTRCFRKSTSTTPANWRKLG